jgi:coenzyme F420-reducing hydrogenase beta subunit
MNNLLCEKDLCTGCMSCYNSCDKKAISITTDCEGFYIPNINKDLCVNCGICNSHCPVINPIVCHKFQQYGYACWSNDRLLRKESSSGGLFSELAKYIIKENGVVYGAAFDENLIVKHIKVTQNKELWKLRGSKYVQSYIGYSYVEIRKLLNKQQKVMFVGTPCQVAGLYSFLGRKYDELYTCEFVCHGVPSPGIFSEYKKKLECDYSSTIKEYKFRDKHRSWSQFNTKAKFRNKKIYLGTWFRDPFLRLFLRNLISKKCCYVCKYTNIKRVGDITIADFWGIVFKREEKEKYKDNGISLALINSNKGEYLFDNIKNNITYYKRDVDVIRKSQKSFSVPYSEPVRRKLFWKDKKNMDFESLLLKYAYPEKMNLEQFLITYLGHNIFIDFVCKCIWHIRKIVS